MVIKKVKIPLYYATLVIIKVKDNYDKVNKKYGINAQNDWGAFVFKNPLKEGEYMAVFHENPTGDLIAHECVHLVNHIYVDRCMNLDPLNDEPQAYLMGWFFNEIDKYFKQ